MLVWVALRNGQRFNTQIIYGRCLHCSTNHAVHLILECQTTFHLRQHMGQHMGQLLSVTL